MCEKQLEIGENKDPTQTHEYLRLYGSGFQGPQGIHSAGITIQRQMESRGYEFDDSGNIIVEPEI